MNHSCFSRNQTSSWIKVKHSTSLLLQSCFHSIEKLTFESLFSDLPSIENGSCKFWNWIGLFEIFIFWLINHHFEVGSPWDHEECLIALHSLYIITSSAVFSLMNIILPQVNQAAPLAPRFHLPDPEVELNMGELVPSRGDLSQCKLHMAGGVKVQGFVTPPGQEEGIIR